jgi:hypothetical protein
MLLDTHFDEQTNRIDGLLSQLLPHNMIKDYNMQVITRLLSATHLRLLLRLVRNHDGILEPSIRG